MVKQNFGLEALGVREKPLHQLRSLHAIRVGGPVVDIGRRHELAALGDSGDEHRTEVGACGVDRGGVSGRSGAKDQDPRVFMGGHWRELGVKMHVKGRNVKPNAQKQ